MPIQLDKILHDIAEEKILHPSFQHTTTKKENENAWNRVGKKNNLSAHEVRSIYKVLIKKYEQEKMKDHSGWKLYPVMEEIHKTSETDTPKEEPLSMEEDEEYEMLEVQEEDEHHQGNTSGSAASDAESPPKSTKSDRSRSQSPDRNEKLPKPSTTTTTSPREEKKLLNTMVSPNSRMNSSTAAALQKKGITMKKTTPNGSNNIKSTNASTPQSKSTVSSNGHQFIAIGKTIQLPEPLKRKLSEENTITSLTKKQHIQTVMVNQSTPKQQTAKATILAGAREVKKTTSSNFNGNSNPPPNSANAGTSSHRGISLITITGNDASGSLIVNGSTNANNSDQTNSSSPSSHTEEIDFRNDIILDCDHISVNSNNAVNGNGNGQLRTLKSNTDNEENQLALGNSDNVLPRNFFKNLCNSKRYESLGLYVANAMNRFDPRTASRVEVKILHAIIDAQNEVYGDS